MRNRRCRNASIKAEEECADCGEEGHAQRIPVWSHDEQSTAMCGEYRLLYGFSQYLFPLFSWVRAEVV